MDPLTLLRKHEPELKMRFGIAKTGIFGSFARGEARIDSDLDVLVTFQERKKTFDNFMGIKSISKTSSTGKSIWSPMLLSNPLSAILS